MPAEFLGDRRAALEAAFFHLQNEKLLEDFRQHLNALERKAQLADASGIHDEAVLARLVESDIRPETLAALTLIPLIEVAWADGKLPKENREAVLEAAEHAGMNPEDDAHQLLEAWLNQKPEAEMLETWRRYVRALCEQLEPSEIDRLKRDLLDRALAVAEATGGFLGIGRVSAAEKAMLEGLAKAFE
ncbi:MAG: hypothetical protein JJ992_17785 [Planctomycetes bacterium]|nr:hypothetical protein [Planctomycetota bacterium]